MAGIQPHVPNLRTMRIHQQHLVLLLQNLQFLIAKNIGRRFGPALIMRGRKCGAGPRNLTIPLHYVRSPWLQHRIVEIADHDVAASGDILQRTLAVFRRAVINGVASPDTGQIGHSLIRGNRNRGRCRSNKQ